MIDPILTIAAIGFALLVGPRWPSIDPGEDAACPADTRRVRGEHADEMFHVCVDFHDGHCFAYEEGLSALGGAREGIDTCMDMFEAPNVRGREPLVMRSFADAERFCGERRKRVCSEDEWELACEGDEHRPFAYGWKVDTSLCNSDKEWRPFDQAKLSADPDTRDAEVERLFQGTSSGRYWTCASTYGVYDMMGNVEEWVASSKRRNRRFRGALMGGFWAKPWTGCRGTNDAHEERFSFYETGFRCCVDPKR